MKKALRLVISVMVILLAVGLVVRFLPSKSVPPSDSGIVPENALEYKALIDGEVCEVPEFLYYTNGNYPSEYTPGEGLKVDDLKGRINRTPVPESWGMPGVYAASGGCPDPGNPNKEYEFCGWYTDEGLTEAFAGSLSAAGKQTLYAEIKVSYWTDVY